MARILVVEDEPGVLDLYEEALAEGGHEVLSAHDGIEAIERLEEDPAVVILDLLLPHMNGYEFLQHLKKSRDHNSLPVIVASAVGTGEWSRHEGAAAFIGKPLDFDELLSIVARLVRDRGKGPGGAGDAESEAPLPDAGAADRTTPSIRLTPRERDVLLLMGEGLYVEEIARRLGLSLTTVRGYVQQVLEGLGAHSQLEAVLRAQRAGLI